jgi:ribosomal protein S18 acetylase RimI-like enzyme
VIDVSLTLEQLADAAWPAAERVPLGPWVLRANAGVTRRANSVFTADSREVPPGELRWLVEQAEQFYAERGLPPVFQISAATRARELDDRLAARGYVLDGASEVWTAAPSWVKRPALSEGVIVRSTDPSAAWFDVAFADDGPERRRVHEQIVRRSPRPRVFLSAVMDGRVAACAMAVGGEGQTGLFCMTTHPEFRRRGLGSALVGEAAAWAVAHGRAGMYLQVMRENEEAKALYWKAGFAPRYGYHYRVKAT